MMYRSRRGRTSPALYEPRKRRTYLTLGIALIIQSLALGFASTGPGASMCGLQIDAMAEARGAASSFDEWVAPLIESRDLSGTVAIRRDGEWVLRQAYGHADLESSVPCQFDTRYSIGSITKQFTAALTMLLVEDGAIFLADPVASVLPEMSGHADITLHHVLSHQAGLARDFPESMAVPSDAAACAGLIASLPRVASAGDVVAYSNCGYVLLAVLIERVGGAPYDEQLRNRILEPLGLDSIGPWDPALDDLATGYDPGVGLGTLVPAAALDLSRIRGAGHLVASAGDLIDWLEEFAHGEFFSDSLRDALLHDHGEGRGYGFGLYQRQGSEVFGHDGVIDGYTAFAEYHRQEEAAIVYVGNIRTHAFEYVETALSSLANGQTLPDLPEIGPAQVTFDAAGVGRYRVHDALLIDIVERDGHLELKGTGGSFTPLVPLQSGEYWYRSRYSRIGFLRDESGEVTGLVWNDAHGSRFELPRVQPERISP